MKILFVAPFPPPLTGNSLPVKVLYEKMSILHETDLINLSKKNHVSGIDSFQRIWDIITILFKYAYKRHSKDLIYLSISESSSGNLRDLIIYFFSYFKLNRVYIHMLGGAGMASLLSKNNWRLKINKFFVSKVGGVIVEGNVQKEVFSKLIDSKKIAVIPNFAQDFLFINEDAILQKFNNVEKINLLFLSNMLPGKGQCELLEAYLELDPFYKSQIRLDFAGKIIDKNWGQYFLGKVNDFPNLNYHGSVSGDVKKKLFHNSHAFCLPTYYPYEGQPFTIIEAYASGNVVLTTNHSGISHIFNDSNGFFVSKQSISDLKEVLMGLIDNKNNISRIALNNFKLAKKTFSQDVFLNKIVNFLESNTFNYE